WRGLPHRQLDLPRRPAAGHAAAVRRRRVPHRARRGAAHAVPSARARGLNMEIILSITVGLLVAIGIWMMLDRGLLRVVLGVVVLGNGVNLAVFTAGRVDGRAAAFVTEAGAPALAANPLPQALVLTAIVIGFALFVFALAVLKRSWELHDNVETDRITAVAEEPAPDLAAPASAQPTQPATPTSGAAQATQAAGASGALPATPSPAAKAARHGA